VLIFKLAASAGVNAALRPSLLWSRDFVTQRSAECYALMILRSSRFEGLIATASREGLTPSPTCHTGQGGFEMRPVRAIKTESAAGRHAA
jgi:hypothetical protein